MSTNQDIQQLIRNLDANGAAAVLLRDFVGSGTWVPEFRGTTTNGTLTYTSQLGEWRRIGSLMWIWGNITVSAITTAPSGILDIYGLPTPPSILATSAGNVEFSYWSAVLPSGYTHVSGQVYNLAAGQYLRPMRNGTNQNTAELQGSELRVGTWRFSGIYRLS